MSEARAVSFRIDTEMLAALNSLAAAAQRDRSFLLNEAVKSYIELQTYHDEIVRAGIRAATEGKYSATAAMRKCLAKLTGKRPPTR
jgi:predicted transcriptional regulator